MLKLKIIKKLLGEHIIKTTIPEVAQQLKEPAAHAKQHEFNPYSPW